VGEQLRALVVEDDAHVASSILRMLARARGCDTRVVGSVAAARQHLGDVDLVIADVGLPDGSGVDIIARARKTEPPPACVLISASVDRERLGVAHDLGVPFLVKPLEQKQLELVVRRARAAKTAFRDRVAAMIDAWGRRYALSPTLIELLSLAVDGQPRAELARLRGVSAHTIEKQIVALLSRTGDRTLEAAARRVLRESIDPE
jgi:two-component system LytT family response regulator